MRGRVQDSITGRFLSPDPNIPDPGFTQSYNRYAYVRNNPLSYIDPSGFREQCIWEEIFHSIGITQEDAEGNFNGVIIVPAPSTFERKCVDVPDIFDLLTNPPESPTYADEGGGGGQTPRETPLPQESVWRDIKGFACSNPGRGIAQGFMAGGTYGLIAGKARWPTAAMGAVGGGVVGWIATDEHLSQTELGVSLVAAGTLMGLAGGAKRAGAVAGGFAEVSNVGVESFSTRSARYVAAAILGAGMEHISGGLVPRGVVAPIPGRVAARGGAAGVGAIFASDLTGAGLDRMCGEP
jgi:hypothetical protein